MKNTYIIKASAILGSQSSLAKSLGVSSPTVAQWANGDRPVPIIFCTAIEQATNGAVTRKDLRPDDWHLIWPELAAKAAPSSDYTGTDRRSNLVPHHVMPKKREGD